MEDIVWSTLSQPTHNQPVGNRSKLQVVFVAHVWVVLTALWRPTKITLLSHIGWCLWGQRFGVREPVGDSHSIFFFFLIYLLIMLLHLSHFRPFTPLHPAQPLPPTFPSYSSCPWVILWLLHFLHYSYPPPVYFPPIIYAIYSLYLSPLSPSHSPIDNPHVLVVFLVCSRFCFMCGR